MVESSIRWVAMANARTKGTGAKNSACNKEIPRAMTPPHAGQIRFQTRGARSGGRKIAGCRHSNVQLSRINCTRNIKDVENGHGRDVERRRPSESEMRADSVTELEQQSFLKYHAREDSASIQAQDHAGHV